MKNIVYIATSMDGYIATNDGGLDWLNEIGDPECGIGFSEFMDSIDALVMGRNTYEKVLSFGVEWPYSKKVFVLSNTVKKVDPSVEGKAEVINGTLKEIIERLNYAGYGHLYIDGGKTIQSFLKEDLIDEMIITKVPVALGEGIPLFENNEHELRFKLVTSMGGKNGAIQYHFKRG